ncbi:excinuclease ABC subunit UvrA [Vicingus serpentipes]|uniref:UvrABC system protein A n=1 Tax=Vicingus serpentipes TaxID=1926625 RepID=A0A5C6RZF4_9FLAO|nr:excinuclease ABC subunit UvrA [Vicingus serpentipes]TXB66752.1 excinuclease ABC subunit UvrA [Vicingus serpentipes]
MTISEEEFIEVEGARVHNLKNISLKIPRNKLVVITGLSGSGKSSLAFDTIYAEGQRRYLETFSAYARQFLGNMERPDVDKIKGLSPVISIEQKTISKNPRSTVGTITEVYDFFRLLYARAGLAYSYNTGELMVKYNTPQIIELIFEKYANKKLLILAPLVKGRKGHYRELFSQIIKQGFLKARIDGVIVSLSPGMQLDRYKTHDIEVVVDQVKVKNDDEKRITNSVETALKIGNNTVMVFDVESLSYSLLSKNLMCPATGISYDEPAPNLFSFNSPYGACKKCNGLGEISEIDINKIIPNNNSTIKKGGIVPLGEYKNNWTFKQIEAIGIKFGFDLNTPLKNISEEAIDFLLNGSSESITISQNVAGVTSGYNVEFEGIINLVERQFQDNKSKTVERWAASFMNKINCTTCNGSRLKQDALFFKIDEKNIADVSFMDISSLYIWTSTLFDKLNNNQKVIAKEVLKEINARLKFLLDVGLTYLSLNRSAKTLSGGEAQRIRLATQIGSQLTNVLYILDEPSIGLHQRDNQKLIQSLKDLRDIGNSIMVVEHDKDIMLESDYIIDIGPKAGIHGGEIVSFGKPADFLKEETETAKYLNGKVSISIPDKLRKGNGKTLKLYGATGNNLKNVDLTIPLGKLVCVTGVSGSGKSTLINETLYPILNQYIYKAVKKPLPYKKIEGLENIDKIIDIDQSPIGRTPRSNPATYTGLFTDIRTLFSGLPEAKIRGYKPGRFSFNVKGGRCETCQGAGLKTIEMNFLPDVYVECSECGGKRYNRETLEVRFKGKSISDVLNMTIEQSVDFFENIPSILLKVKTLKDVGLGYVHLGQPSTTLSGGEAQRIKLATELAKKQTGNTFYILDEPSTGLHFEDIRILLDVINKLVDSGNSVLIIEHNLDIIKVADYIIDIGPEGGQAGGEIVAEGTPFELLKNKKSITAEYLKKEML